jgi:hypothetical protein
MFHELRTPIPVEVIKNEEGLPTGSGRALGICGNCTGYKLAVFWLVALDDTGLIVLAPIALVRLRTSPVAKGE